MVKSHTPTPPPEQNANIMALMEELKLLHQKIDLINPCKYKPSQVHIESPAIQSLSHITISTWNCRGISNSIPYLFHLFENGTDIIALSEHWLWPYNIQNLSSLHPDYDGFGVCDDRLNENCSLTRGCGGVGFLWKKSLNIIPKTTITSDKFCVIQLLLQNSTYLTLIAVYLPCSNYSDDTYKSYFQDLQSVVSSYDLEGPIIICGDFNVDISNDLQSSRSRLLNDLVDSHSLYVVSQSSQFSGPKYTFFKNSCYSTIDYIITNSSIAGNVLSCFTHPHHPLNLSDHLPISISLSLTCPSTVAATPPFQRINWAYAIETNKIPVYVEAISAAIQPLLNITGQSIEHLNDEISYVCNLLSTLAVSYLPVSSKKKKHKKKFSSPELKNLCRTSKKAWCVWNANGRPTSGPLYDDKVISNKRVKQCVHKLQASLIRQNIQRRDTMFKTKDPNRFKLHKSSLPCSKINIDNHTSSNPSEICSAFRNYFCSLSASHVAPNVSESKISSLLQESFGNENNILQDEISINDVSSAVKLLKSGKAAGPDGVTAEHIKYAGHSLIKWLHKIFNRIQTLEEIPSCLKEGTIIPVYKAKGKDPLMVTSYRGITISSVLSKLLESIILKRLDCVLNELNIPHCLQTAYRKGLSCSDAVFATQEALLTCLRDGGHPYLCLFDLEKAFDSVEFCTLLERLFMIGVNGKCWRIMLSWYSSAFSTVRVGSTLCDPFPIARGVKQGSILSPILFLTVVDILLRDLKKEDAGLSIYGSFVGGAAHADDLRTIAPSKSTISKQINIIENFTSQNHLTLNSEKTEIIKISHCRPENEKINLSNCTISVSTEAKCLGVWWSYNLSALRSVQENITKARKAFFAFGKIEAFQGHLNPLSAISIFESCIIPILLYGCDTWLLDSSTILLLDQFQNEIGRRILKLPKNTSAKVVRICLNFPSMACRVLLRKLTFLGKLLQAEKHTISSSIFTSAIITDPLNVSIIQQCKMLESLLSVHVLEDCLHYPEAASDIVKCERRTIINTDMDSLVTSAMNTSAKYVAHIATKTSWSKLWDLALDRGSKGTTQLQRIVFHLSKRIYQGYICPLCQLPIDPGTSWISHVCFSHSVTLNLSTLTPDDIADLLCHNSEQVFGIHFPK